MKNYLKTLLFLIIAFSVVACGRRVPRHSGNGRRGNRNVTVTKPTLHKNNNNVSVSPKNPGIVDKTKPSIEQIKLDLVGHSLSEGLEKEKCWFHEDWRWKISYGEIHGFRMEEVLRDDDNKYVFLASMRLDGELNSFNAHVKVSYLFSEIEGWELEYVNSIGMTIIRSYEYEDCVGYEIKDDGWGGINALFITNKTELELVVGVEIVADGQRKRYAVRVSPCKKTQVGGLFAGGNVTSYEVAFVERF